MRADMLVQQAQDGIAKLVFMSNTGLESAIK
jgi:hypothetical protein